MATTDMTDTSSEGGTKVTQQYIGPSAMRIADLIPHRVSFDRGWFWTTTAICHGGKSDGLAFRQRPDGNGIDVRCHTGGCTRGLVVTHLEALIGLPIWNAYEPVSGKPRKARWLDWWTPKRIAVAGVIALVVAAPLLRGHGVEGAILNLVGLGIAALLVWRFTRRFKRWLSL